MNQLQTVLSALEDAKTIDNSAGKWYRNKKAIAIVKQMMQAEPVAEVVQNTAHTYVEWKMGVHLSVGTKLYAAPQAAPAHLEEQPDGSVVDTRNALKGMSGEPIKPTDEELFKIYCLDEDAGDWRTPSNNYYAGVHMGWLADAELRRAKSDAHAALDPL